MGKKVVHDKVRTELHLADKALTAEDAKKLLGWETPKEGKEKDWETWVFKDLEGNKVRLNNNKANRPFKMTLAKRYANEMLRGKWHFNGEPITFNRLNELDSGQHRLVALILAEQERLQSPNKWASYGIKGPLSVEALVVYGISEKNEVADTIDIGQKRSLGDVIFRRHEFAEPNEKEQKRLSTILAGAIRLVWIRLGGGKVSDAPHFPHSEALEFLEKHPQINKAVQWVWNEEGGSGIDGKKISSLLSPAYAAGMMYLMGTCKSDPEGEEIKYTTWSKAEKFWTLLANGANLTEGDPILTLTKAMPKVDASGGKGRDILCGLIAKAWNAFIDGEKLDAKEIRIKEQTNKDTGKRELAEYPRVGGLDIEREPVRIEEAGGYAVGDKCWVHDANGVHWSGLVTGFTDEDHAEVLADEAFRENKEENETYEVAVVDLREDEPKSEKEAA